MKSHQAKSTGDGTGHYRDQFLQYIYAVAPPRAQLPTRQHSAYVCGQRVPSQSRSRSTPLTQFMESSGPIDMADHVFALSRRADAFPPMCVEANATQAATLAGCGATDWHCACNSYEFLAIVQPMIYQLCGANASEALSSAQQYCVGENPDLLQSRTQEFLPPVCIVTVLSILAVALRFHARRTSKTALGADDWLAVCALVCAVAFSILQPLGLTWGEGRHLFMVSPDAQARSSKSTLASAWMIAISLICLKDSICALYLRIFGHLETFRLVIVTTGVVVPIIQLLTVMLFTLSCHPIAYFWNKDIVGGTCWNFQQVIVGLAAADLATGLWVLFLPVPILVGLQATTSRKIALILMFLTGGFACISAAMRIPFVLLIDIYDTSWSLVPFTIWSNIELHIGYVGSTTILS